MAGCNLPAQTPPPAGTILPTAGGTSSSPAAEPLNPGTPTALIPVTGGNDFVAMQCQFCVNNDTHALLVMPERASFVVSEPVVGINCLTAKVQNGQRVVLCRGANQPSFTLNVCIENANCLQLPIALQPCPGIPRTGVETAIATFSGPTAVAVTPISTKIVSTAPASTVTSLPTQTFAPPPPATATTAASHPQPTKAIRTTPQVTVSPEQPAPAANLQDPGEFTRWYFGRVWQERDYQNLWDNYLTQNFKTHVSANNYEEYTAWWDSVERVDVNSVNVIQNNGTNAWVRVNVTFVMKDGRTISNQEYDYALLFDATRQTWMFNYNP